MFAPLIDKQVPQVLGVPASGQGISAARLRPVTVGTMTVVSLRIVAAILRRPRLWLEAIRVSREIGCKEWWKRLLLVPPPDPEYFRWRVTTAYGSPDADVEPADVVRFLQWRRRQRES